jgi:methyltransferase (TIGR00027 family)
MAEKGVGNTALGAAICCLIEQYQPQETRLFEDPVVKDVVGGVMRVMLGPAWMRNFTLQQTEAAGKGIYGAQVCRTRFIDEAVQTALAKGIGQVVILGAGLDTRPYRLPGIEKAKVFEIDLPAAQESKKKNLQKHFGRLPEHVTFVPIDFDTQTLETVLGGTVFDPAKPAMFLWEGVTQYLSEKSVHQTLSFVGSCAPGSIIVFTYVLKSVIEHRSDIPGVEKMLERVAKSNAAWTFGLEPSSLKAYLQSFHLDLVADVGSTDYQEMYLQPIKRELAVFEGERVAQAVVTR